MDRLTAVLVLVALAVGTFAAHRPAATATAVAPTREDYAVVNFVRRLLGIRPAEETQVRPLLSQRVCVPVDEPDRWDRCGKEGICFQCQSQGQRSSCGRSSPFSLLSSRNRHIMRSLVRISHL